MKKICMFLLLILGLSTFSSASTGDTYKCNANGLNSYTQKIQGLSLRAGDYLAIATDDMDGKLYDETLKKLNKAIKREKKKIEKCFE